MRERERDRERKKKGVEHAHLAPSTHSLACSLALVGTKVLCLSLSVCVCVRAARRCLFLLLFFVQSAMTHLHPTASPTSLGCNGIAAYRNVESDLQILVQLLHKDRVKKEEEELKPSVAVHVVQTQRTLTSPMRGLAPCSPWVPEYSMLILMAPNRSPSPTAEIIR